MKNFVLSFTLLFCLLLPLKAASYDDFFKEAFGKSPPTQTYPLSVTLYLDGENLGKINIQYNPYTLSVVLHTKDLETALKPVLTEESYQLLRSLFDPSGLIKQKQLEAIGFSFEFNQTYVSLFIISPPHSRRLRTIKLSSTTEDIPIDNTATSTYSGFINFDGRIAQRNDSVGNDGVMNMNGLITYKNLFSLESEGYYDYNLDSPLLLRGARLVHDEVSSLTSYYIGDIGQEQVFNAAGSSRVFGVGLNRSYQGFGWTEPKAGLSESVYVEKPSIVTIEVNQNIAFQKKLQGGHYLFREIPLYRGKNNVVILISPTDGSPTKLIQKTQYYSGNLAKPNVFEYQVMVGHPVSISNEAYAIESHDVLYGSSIRYGYSPTTMLTAAFTKNIARSTATLGLKTLNRFGELEFDFITDVSPTEKLQHGIGVALQSFDFFTPKGQLYTHRILARVANQQSANLNDIETIEGPRTSLSYDVFFKWNHAFWTRLRTDISTFPYSDTKEFGQELTLTLRRSLADISGFIGWKRLINNDLQWRFGFQFFTLGGFHSQRLKIDQRHDQVHTRIETNLHTIDFDAFQYNMSYDYTQTNTTYALNTRYKRRFFTELALQNPHSDQQNHTLGVSYRGSRGYISHRMGTEAQATLQETSFGTTFAFVDGHAGFSQRIDDTFILFYAPESDKKNKIRFFDESQIDFFGPAIITRLLPNHSQSVSVLNSSLPEGLFLEKSSFSVTPRKRQGIALPVTSGGFLMFQALLVDAKNTPLTHAFGEIYPVSNPGLTQPFFTNKQGYMVVSGLKTGDYTVKLSDDHFEPFQITLKSVENTVIDLGTLHVKEK